MSKHIAKRAMSMSAASFIVRILGFIRDMILAGFLGATGLSDAFFVAFRIPNLLREIFAEGSMSSGLIPVLSSVHKNKGEGEAVIVVRVVFTFIVVFVGLVTIAGVIFSPYIVRLIAPGFEVDSMKFDITVILTRIMFPFLFFVSLAALNMGALNVKKVFFIPALSSAWYNLSIITFALVCAMFTFEPVIVVAVAVTVGGMMQYLFQLPAFFRKGYSIYPLFKFSHPDFKRIGSLILPATVGMAAAQLNIFISTILASFLAIGSITYLYYAMRLIQFPIGIFGVAVGMASLATLSDHAANGDYDKLAVDFAFSLKFLLMLAIPSMVGLIMLRQPIITTLFQHGAFDAHACEGTQSALVYYSVGLWAMIGTRPITSAFYSMQNTALPVKIASISFLSNIFLSIILLEPMHHNGLALATSCSSVINFLLLFYFLNKTIKNINIKDILTSVIKVSIAAALMGLVAYSTSELVAWTAAGGTAFKGFALFLIILACGATFFVAALLLKCEGMASLLRMFKRTVGDTE